MYRRVTPARYGNPLIREHLVCQYLLGTLSLRARRRLESLMVQDSSWYELLGLWHGHLEGAIPVNAETPPSWVWDNIAAKLGHRQNVPVKTRWWQQKWPAFSLTAVVLLILLSSPLLLMTEPTLTNPSYLAVMSSAEQHDPFVLMAYQGDKPGKSSLRLQWNTRNHPSTAGMDTAMLWAKDKQTGQMTLLGRFSELQQPKLLTPTEWNALKNSSEVLVTLNKSPNSTVLFAGACLELSASPT